MDGILNELSPANFSNAIEKNLYSWIPVFGKLGQTSEDDPAGVKRSITDIPSSLFNSVMDTHLTPEQADPAIQRVMSDARAHNVPVLWWIGPSTQPVDLDKRLEKSGFILEEESPGMAVDLANLNADLKKPEGLSVQIAQNDNSRKEWCHTMALGFEWKTPFSVSALNGWQKLLECTEMETVQAFTGWLDGKPVATSLLLLAAGVVGIYAVATVPESRRKGIGAWMTLSPLLEARKMGYRAGILQASEMGENVYRLLGFREYCRIKEYYWKP